MKNLILLICTILLPSFLFAQVQKDSVPAEVIKINTDLGVGQEFDFGQTAVSFIKVISDSRCPKQVTCIWPGEAKVLLGINWNGEYLEKEVVVSGSGAEFPLANDLLMQVSHLRPYPETTSQIAPEEYSLSFMAVLPEDQ